MKIFKNKFFYCLLLAGLGISISGCSTDNPSSVHSSNEPTSSEGGSSSSSTSETTSSEATSTSSSESSSESSSSSEEDPPTPPAPSGSASQAASFVKNVQFTADIVDDILSTDSPIKSLIKKAPEKDDPKEDPKDDPSPEPPVPGIWEDRLQGKCELVDDGVDDYYSWTDFAPYQGNAASVIVQTIKDFGKSMFDNLDMFRTFIPNDIKYNEYRRVVLEYAPGIDVPLDYYIEGNDDDYTFYCGICMTDSPIPEMNTTMYNSLRVKKENDGNLFEYKIYSLNNYYSYLPVRLISNGYNDLFYYDTTTQKYNLHNVAFSSDTFTLCNGCTTKPLQVVLASGVETYLSVGSDGITVTKLTSDPLNYYLTDNGDGSLTISVEAGTDVPNTGDITRYETVPSMRLYRWKEGELYEKANAYDVPSYAIGNSDYTFFKAVKDNDGRWAIYNRNSFINEFFASQKNFGWVVIEQLHRQNDGKIQTPDEVSLASVETNDIITLSPTYDKQTIELSAFNGFDEMRQYDTGSVVPTNTVTYDDVKSYYYNGHADVYNKGTLLMKESSGVSIFAGGYGSYNASKLAGLDDKSNCGLYHGSIFIQDDIAAAINLIKTKNLTCKYGDIDELMTSLNNVVDNIEDYISLIDIYGMSEDIGIEAYYNRYKSVFDTLNIKDEIDEYMK